MQKPTKLPGFPLFLHANGQSAKKIDGRTAISVPGLILTPHWHVPGQGTTSTRITALSKSA